MDDLAANSGLDSKDRAARVAGTLESYAGGMTEAMDFVISDFITDVMHYARVHDVDMDWVMTNAEKHFKAEV